MNERDTFSVVFLCTGNRFRSPIAEVVFRAAVDGLPVHVRSLGTLHLGPVPPLDEALEQADRLGLDLSAHKARGLSGENLAPVDLVVGFERMHVVSAVVDAHARRERTFTLPELVGLLDRTPRMESADPIDNARAVLARAHRARPDRTLAAVPELGDPLGGSSRLYRETADRVLELTERLARELFRVVAARD